MEAYIIYPLEEQEQIIIDFLESLNIPFEKKAEKFLPNHVSEGIKKGQNDIKSGRIITFDEFKQNLKSTI